MPGPNDDTDLDLDGLDGDGGDDGASDDGGDAGAAGADGAASDDKDAKGEAKRIRDLQSLADKAEARANKAEKALAEALRGQGGAAGSNDPATQALMEELRESALDAVFGEHPELRDYGIDRSLIEGNTRAQVRENAAQLVSLIKDVATKSRNKALADAGVTSPQSGTTRQKPVDYANMKDEDFLKMLDSM